MKPILSIETSGALCSAVLFYNENKFYQFKLLEKHSHSEKLFLCIDSILKSTGVKLNECRGIAVSSGPGSFTGLRIGLSAAKGLAAGAEIPIALIPTFDALALQISGYLKDEDEFAIGNRVGSEEVYYARFKIKGNNYIFAENLQIISNEEFLQKVENLNVFGNAVQNQKSLISAPDALFVAQWCSTFGNDFFTYDYDYLEPNYLKNFIVKERKK
jgi:tRNA threonylcarbamoyladenosine biosynthesis protein TsaB